MALSRSSVCGDCGSSLSEAVLFTFGLMVMADCTRDTAGRIHAGSSVVFEPVMPSGPKFMTCRWCKRCETVTVARSDHLAEPGHTTAAE
jgi:hypothetical protein